MRPLMPAKSLARFLFPCGRSAVEVPTEACELRSGGGSRSERGVRQNPAAKSTGACRSGSGHGRAVHADAGVGGGRAVHRADPTRGTRPRVDAGIARRGVRGLGSGRRAAPPTRAHRHFAGSCFPGGPDRCLDSRLHRCTESCRTRLRASGVRPSSPPWTKPSPLTRHLFFRAGRRRGRGSAQASPEFSPDWLPSDPAPSGPRRLMRHLRPPAGHRGAVGGGARPCAGGAARVADPSGDSRKYTPKTLPLGDT